VSKIEMKNDEYLYDKHGNTNHNVKWYNLKGVAICYETGTEEKQELLFEVERKYKVLERGTIHGRVGD
jgi:hypothetical protein